MVPLKPSLSRRQALAAMSAGSAAAILPAEEFSTAKAGAQFASLEDGYQGFLNRMTLMDFAKTAAGQPVLISEPGREGVFVFVESDLSIEVAADITQGLYVAPAADPTGASGAWVRKFTGPVNAKWFGFVDDFDGATGTDNLAAFNALMATLKARATPNASTFYQGGESVLIPSGRYYFSGPLEFKGITLIFEGEGFGSAGGTNSILNFPADIDGIRIQSHNTLSDGVEATPTKGANGTIIRNLHIAAESGGTSGDGIRLRTRAAIQDVTVTGFGRHGISIIATSGSGGATEGNANNWSILRARLGSNQNAGLKVDGGDANAGLALMVDATGNGRYGINDTSFLGNTYIGCHSEGNGLKGQVSYSGNRYTVLPGQEVGASSNAPSGTTTDNTWWRFDRSGGVLQPWYRAWFSGIEVREGAGYKSAGSSNRSVWIGCYSEGSQMPNHIEVPSMFYGNTQGNGFLTAAHMGATAGAISSVASDGMWNHDQGIGTWKAGTLRLKLGGDPDNGTLLFWQGLGASSSKLRMSSNNLVFENNGTSALLVTADSTTDQFGTGAAYKNAVYAPSMMLGGTIATARRIIVAESAPTSGARAQGEQWFNLTPAIGEPAGWQCSVAGSPGTWVKIPGQATAPTTTYAAPSGGATVDTECRASLAQLAADLADLKSKLAASGATA